MRSESFVLPQSLAILAYIRKVIAWDAIAIMSLVWRILHSPKPFPLQGTAGTVRCVTVNNVVKSARVPLFPFKKILVRGSLKRRSGGQGGWRGTLMDGRGDKVYFFVWPRNEIWYKVLLSVWYPRKNTCYPISWQTENETFRKYDSQFVSIEFQFISFCNEIWKKKFSICESCGAAKSILAYQNLTGSPGSRDGL